MAQHAALTKAPVTKAPALRTTPPLVQAKLKLGAANDRFEREADSAASTVTSGVPFSIPPTITPIGGGLTQRACSACKLGDEETRGAIQRKCASCAATMGSCECDQEEKEEQGLTQRKVDRRARRSANEGTRVVEEVVSTPGRPLPTAVRQEMEQGFGRDFSRVRIHDSPRAAASAEAIGAHAYTVGNHIAFNQGQFRPDTRSGRFLLAHELAHTVQQTGARPARMDRVSRPSDRHEAEANRAAQAAVSGAPMPALSPGAAPISRNIIGDIGRGLVSGGRAVVGGAVDLGEAAVEGAVELGEAAVDLAGDALDAVSGLWDTAVAIAEAIGGSISLDGTTIVIDIPQFEPCPEFEFQFQLSDIGLDPTLYFPIAAGGFTVGVLTVIGALGVTVNLDPGLAFRLEGCTFGPGQIRISPLPPRVTVMGATSIATASAVSLGADLGLRADLMGVMTIPFDPPIVLVAPAVGVTAGGTMAFMLQNRGTVSHYFNVSMGLGDFSAATHIGADIGYAVDLAAGLFGSVDLLGLELCRVGWPLYSFHDQIAAHLTLDAALSIGTSGFDFQFDASARPLAHNPLDDLSFVFDQSRLEDDCWLCEFFTNNNLMPGQNGYNWSNLEPQLPRLPGPLPGVYARNPMFTSGALCRGTCGINCPPDPSCDPPVDRIECEERGDRHYWHTYVNYATCGSHQGCRDHDSCYDYAATMPIWGFGGFLIGPMYRACDLESLCTYSFKQAVTWARGGGLYDSRLTYADRVDQRPGCLGPCPKKEVKPEGEAEVMRSCLQDRELWTGLQIGDSWGKPFGPWSLYRGFIAVPYIGGINYGIDGSAAVGVSASADLGPINLEKACLTYDPATQVYTGSAELVAYLAGFASASVTGQLAGWGSDLACLIRWLTLRAKLTGYVSIILPGEVRAKVLLECRDGDLEVFPSLSLQVNPGLRIGLTAGAEFDVLWKTVVSREWKLFEESIDRRWEIGFEFDPFIVGQQPDFRLFTDALEILDVLLDVFEPGRSQDIDHRVAQNPIAEADRSLLLPCLDDDDDDEARDDCPRRATGADGDRLTTPGQRAPTYGGVRTLTITSGASAGVATWMEAAYLTNSHPPGQETNDTVQRGIYRQPGLPTRGCVRSGYKQSQVYVKGHLLNANLGGPAEERNLFPITGQANSDHKNQVEQHGLRVVPRVNGGSEVIYYRVEVQNISNPREIRTSSGAGTDLYEISATFHCEVADYQLCTNDTLRRNSIQSVNIASDFVFHPSGGKAFDTIMKPCPR